MRKLAIGLLVIGLATLLYGFTLDTSVSVRETVAANGGEALAGLVPEGARATDPARADRRQTLLIGGGLLAVVGAVLLVGAGMRRPSVV